MDPFKDLGPNHNVVPTGKCCYRMKKWVSIHFQKNFFHVAAIDLPQIFLQNNSDIMLQPYHQHPEDEGDHHSWKGLDHHASHGVPQPNPSTPCKCTSSKTQFLIKDILIDIQKPINLKFLIHKDRNQPCDKMIFRCKSS